MTSESTASLERTAYISFILLGLATTVHGVAMPFLLDAFGITLGTGGLLFLARSLGYIAGSSTFAWFHGRMGAKRHIGTGALLGAVALGLLPLAPYWSVLLVIAALAGFGFSTVDVGFNATVASLPPKRSLRAMHWLHFSFSIGALVGPALLAQVYVFSESWSLLYIVATASLTLLFVLWLATPPPQQADTTEHAATSLAAGPYASFWFWLLLVCMLLYCGAEISLTSWLTTYLVRELMAPVEYGALAVSLFWAGLASGRALAGWIAARFNVRFFLLMLFGGSAAGCAAVAGFNAIPAVMAAVFLTGLFFSATFPSLILFGTAMFPDHAHVVSGGMLTAASLGALILPAGLGYIGDFVSLSAGIWVLAALLLFSFILVGTIPRSFSKQLPTRD